MKRWIKVLLIILAIAAVLVIGVMLLFPSNTQVTVSSLNIDEAQVSRGDIQMLVHGTGAIEVATVREVFARTSGRVVEVHKEDGDMVEEGELIAVLENDALSTQMETQTDDLYLKDLEISTSRGQKAETTIRSPMAGRVKQLHAQPGDDLNTVQRQYGALLTLSTDGRMRIQLPPVEDEPLEIPADVKVRIGEKVEPGTVLSSDASGILVQIANDTYDVGETAVVVDAGGRVLGEGLLEINKPVQVSGVSGKIRTVHIEENDEVRANTRLFTLEDDAVSLGTEKQIMDRDSLARSLEDTKEKLEWLTLRSPIDGVVGNILLDEGATIQEGAQVATVIQTDRAKLRLAVDELDVATVLPGQPASIKVDALPGKVYQAQVERVLPLGTRESGVTTYDVLLYMDAQDNMLPLMSISGDIVVESRDDVLLVPVASLITVGDDTYVMLMPTDADLEGYNEAQRRPSGGMGMMGGGSQQNDAMVLQSIAPQLMRKVELGLVSSEYAQVVSGVEEGDHIVLPRSNGSLFSNMMRSMGGN